MPFGSLWLAVVVATVGVFIASSLVHMLLGYHKADHRGLSNEEAARAGIAASSPSPGTYFIPYCESHKQLGEPAVVEKFVKGPVAIVTVLPSGPPRMAKHLAAWLGLCLCVSFLCSYIARHTLAPGADPLTVMRITGAIAFGCYGVSHLSDSIWKGQPWSNTLRALVDAAIYAVVTGLAFRVCWPAH